MTRRLWALLQKELRQHGPALAGLWVITAGVFAVMLLAAMSGNRELTLLEAHAGFTRLFVPLIAAIMGHRLVVAEFYGRTQLFLEGLPVRRAEWMALKAAFGFGVVGGAALLSLAVVVAVAGSSEALETGFVLLMACRTALWAACVWCFFLLMGTAGRLRFAIYFAVILGMFVVDALTELEWRQAPPFSLVDERLPLERSEWPSADLWASLGIALGMGTLALLLSVLRDGSLTESLSRRMSQREKVLLALVVFVTLMGVEALDEKKPKDPYEMQGAHVLHSKRADLHIDPGSPDVGEMTRARELLATLEGDLIELSQWLDWRDLPPLFIAQRDDLDGRLTEPVALAESDGVLLRANFQSADFDPYVLRFDVLQQVVYAHTDGRSQFEPRGWITDGLLRWWVERRLPAGETSRSLLRGLCASRLHAVDDNLLRWWTQTNERFGPPVAEGLAHTGIVVLEERAGPDAVNRLARAFLGQWAPLDGRSVLYERRHPPRATFEKATGQSWPAFLRAWNAGLRRMREERADELQHIPVGRAHIEVKAGQGDIRDVAWGVRFDRPPPPGTLVALAHFPLDSFDVDQVSRLDLRRQESTWTSDSTEHAQALSGRYGAGERAFLAVEVHSPALGGPLRLLTKRVTFR